MKYKKKVFDLKKCQRISFIYIYIVTLKFLVYQNCLSIVLFDKLLRDNQYKNSQFNISRI